jgi:hypothetical protein
LPKPLRALREKLARQNRGIEVIRLGNASAPRWYGERLRNLDGYIDGLVSFGATSTELILHHGPSDEGNRRVAIQESHWQSVSEKFWQRGLHCDFHASLAPAFSLRRWERESRRVQAQYRPLLRFGEQVAIRAGTPILLVIHAANAIEIPSERNARSTAEFLAWALEESGQLGGGLRFALELRHDPDRSTNRFDTDRGLLRRFVQQFETERVGICWDIGNDLQQSVWKGIGPEPPESGFLRQVVHVHAHARGPAGDLHYPLLSAREPASTWLALLPAAGYSGSVTMEIRYRHAAARGDPMDTLGKSYQVARGVLEHAGAHAKR